MMISQSILITVAAGIIIIGVIPAIAAIVLMKNQKINDSDFKMGVVTYAASVLICKTVALVEALIIMPPESSDMNRAIENSTAASVVLAVLTGVIITGLLLVCIIAFAYHKTFDNAVSFGIGAGAGYMFGTAISMGIFFFNLLQINKGVYMSNYGEAVQSGYVNTDDIKMTLEEYTSFTVSDGIFQVICALGMAMLFVGASVFIMYGICRGRVSAVVLLTAILFVTAEIISYVVKNNAISTVLICIIGVCTLICGIKMKSKFTENC